MRLLDFLGRGLLAGPHLKAVASQRSPYAVLERAWLIEVQLEVIEDNIRYRFQPPNQRRPSEQNHASNGRPTLHYWLEMGVDGLRLDAIPYLVEREGTNCENLPETHAVLKRIRAEIDAHFADRMLLAEANQWPEDTYPYFGDGDECHMAFHFPLMPRMYMAIAQEDRNPITDIMRQTPEIPESCQWAIFLRNHDELTLEMVTQNEREYLWNTYAADRADADQSRHPPAPGAAARQRPAQDRADERAAAVDARHAGDLLRRRDRHGRQHLSGRPRRRAHADAMVARPQWRVLAAPTRSSSTRRRSRTRSSATRRSTSRRSSRARARC